MNVSKTEIPIISFFSGGGFLDMGFEQAGFRTVFSNELDEDFSSFYKEGMGSWAGEDREISYIGDIKNVKKSDISSNVFRETFGIIGGPPCQDFSVRGTRAGFEGLRGTLTYSFYEKIIDFEPSFFVMENVPGLIELQKSRKVFNEILKLFKENYVIKVVKLNALHYGVPQHRERIFVIGLEKNILAQASNYYCNGSWMNITAPIYPKAETKYRWGEPSFKKDLINTQLPTPPFNLCVGSIIISEDKSNHIPNAKEFFNIQNLKKISNIEEGDTYRPSFKRLHRNKYSPTSCYGNNEVHLNPILNRRLSVREALRIQSVPDSYVLKTPGKLSKKFKMIGNGVPVPLSKAIADSIKNFFTTI